ncbi:MAG TPA: hypothetical protein H9725_10110 [Candidatus Faecalibacterium gallistercoris]|uniref:Lipoprotein n=1 Tax=Candidatus Faecalibacterium gallistercoris TaxID=2838579 RepID=A0A9D2JMI5_9FIRM|nr:hypothetical protein [Candidatus Faecalibacterium gallistercoris]
MKLKRILSLALSGVLAVSMLTACGGGGIGGALSDRSSAIRSELNGAQDMMNYKANDRDLKDALYTVAGTLTANQVTGGVATDAISNTVEQLTGYGDIWLGEWDASAADETATYVKVFVYNTDDEAFDTNREVAYNIAKTLEVLDLKSDLATDAGKISYSGNVGAYRTTVGSGDEAIHALVVGVAITQTVPAAE